MPEGFLNLSPSAAVAIAVLLLALSVYLKRDSLGRYIEARAGQLTIKDAAVAEKFAKKATSALQQLTLRDIARGLAMDLWFKEHFFDTRLESSHIVRDIQQAQVLQDTALGKLSNSLTQQEARMSRVEVEVGLMKEAQQDLVRDVRDGQKELREALATEMRAMRESNTKLVEALVNAVITAKKEA